MKISFTKFIVAFCCLPLFTDADFNGIRKLPPSCDRDNDGFDKAGGSCGGTDCNDNNPDVNPDAPEICGNLIDDNCNGLIDEGCATGDNRICDTGTPNAGASCTSDVECGGACNDLAENTGTSCSSDEMCPPNGGKPSERGKCEVVAGVCIAGPSAPPTPSPTSQPTASPTPIPTSDSTVTYYPGDLTVSCDGGKLTLSTGMQCRLLTTAGQPVQFTDGSGGQSAATMHGVADGATVIPHPSDGGWYYVSNSERGSGSGGVGSIRFNANGEVIGYQRDLSGTSRNCGGGRTYWNTWVTCEENGGSGQLYEVNPVTGVTQQISAVPVGGNYESFAFDDQDPLVEARFYTTEDSSIGALVRYTPATSAFTTGNDADILSSPGGSYDYLVLNSDNTFSWSTSESEGRANANTYFPNAEGIDVINRILFFVSKAKKKLFELDLENETWSETSTVSGAFNLQPDQLGRIIGDGDILYFCEDGGSDCDIHARDATGKFFTIVRGDGYSTETTGLAFSPNAMFMYVAFQGNSNVYTFWREDGLPFDGQVVNTKYH